MKKRTAKTVASALVLTFGLTMVPTSAFAVSSNIVAETENKTTLTVSQIQDLAVIYNDTVDTMNLQMKQLELQEQMARNERRTLENQIQNLGSSAGSMGGSGDLATGIAGIKDAIDKTTTALQTPGLTDEQKASYQLQLLQLNADLVALQSAAASQQSAAAQLESGYEQLSSGIDQINDGLDDLETGREDLRQAMKDLETQMRYSSAYQALGIVQMQSAIDVMEKNLELVNKSIQIYELQEKLGMATTLSVDTQRVSKVELEKSIADNKEQLDNLKRSLNLTIGRTASTPLEVVPMQLPVFIEAAPAFDGKLVQKFVDNDLTLRDLDRERDDLKDSVEDDMGSDEKQQIDYNVESVDQQIKDQRQAVSDNVKAMLAKINSDGEAYKISRQKYVNEKKNFEIAQKKFELGMISQVQLLQAEASLLQAEMTNMQNGYAYYFDWQKYNMAADGIDTSRLP